jgi:hypothetical protein
MVVNDRKDVCDVTSFQFQSQNLMMSKNNSLLLQQCTNFHVTVKTLMYYVTVYSIKFLKD